MRARRSSEAEGKQGYASYRMGLAVDRLIAAASLQQKHRAARWAIAWSLATGARPLRRLSARGKSR